jgi:crotonobetainyl-CoA:carnitine CoA-transferase CaiB-like acyl-CoA transferase
MCKAMGNPEWTKDDTFSTLPERKKHEPRLNHLVEQWTSQYEPEHIMALLQQEGVAAGVVQNAEDICSDVQLKERECFWRGNHRELGKFSYLGQPSRLSMTPAKLYREAPSLGEHNEYICSEILGMSESEYDRCLVEGVFGQITS